MRYTLVILIFATSLFCTNAQNKDWAKYNRYAAENASLSSKPDVVFMGNSITYFWTRADSTFFKNNNFINRGISGQTTCEMLARFRQDVINLRPRAVVILAGINDIAQNNGYISLENILGNIISMCELAKINRIEVVLCSILPCDIFKWKPEIKPAQQIVELNALIKQYAAKNGIYYVDYHKALSTHEGAMLDGYSEDRCHPNRGCYKMMAPMVIDGIRKTLKSDKQYYIPPTN